jgi:hypothetical protein
MAILCGAAKNSLRGTEIFKLFYRKFQYVFVFQEACAGCQPLLPVLGSASRTRPLPGPKHQVIVQ